MHPVVVSSKKEWNYAVEREVAAQASAEAQALLQYAKYGFLKITIHMPLDVSYQVGQLVSYTNERLGLSNKVLRVNDVEHTIHGTSINMLEDVGSI